MFKNKAELIARLTTILKDKAEQEAIIACNEREIDDLYESCLDEGISAQPICEFETGNIYSAEQELEALKKEYDTLAQKYQKNFGQLEATLLWSQDTDQKNTITPSMSSSF